MNIVLLGPQGSGKGTQGEMLASQTGMSYFDVGSYLRSLAKERPDIDEMVNKRGVLIPDDLMYKIVRDYLIEQNSFDNIIFDGYPRSLPQWNLLENFLQVHGSDIAFVVVLEIPEEETIRRLSARRMDAAGHIYNLITNPPPEGTDISTLTHREDDQPEAIQTRLAAYRTSTAPLVNYLKEGNKLIEIDGTQSIEDIQTQILAGIQKAA